MSKIHPIIREILKNRGVLEDSDILEFLSEKPNLTYDPFLLKDLEAGVDLLLSFISQNKNICIYGDYDADGVSSISLMLQILSHLTKNLTYYIPSRFEEGYGLNKEALKLIQERGADLIITVDCGSVSYEEVEFGKSLGMSFIVTDHHNINDTPADCILINPKQMDCPYPFKHLSGCGVAFKLAQGIQRKAGLPKSVLTEVLDLVAIATVGDIVPLIDENRTLTKYGMEIISGKRRPGLKALMQEVGLAQCKIKSDNIAYIIVPHLNAAGRLLDARVGVELLTSNDALQINKCVKQLIESNLERRRIQEEAFTLCKEIIQKDLKDDLFFIVDAKNIHEGIAGIVAGKIKDEYRRPTVIVTPSCKSGYVKGSGRSINGLNLYELLKKHEEMFSKFGGHSGACGFSMREDRLEELRELLNRDMSSLLKDNRNIFDSKLPIDVIIKEADLDFELASAVEKLAPFGCQNEKPLFQINFVQPTNVFFMGNEKQHVRFSGVSDEGNCFSCVLFKKAQDYTEILHNGSMLNLAGYPDINTWNGNSKIQFVLKGITC